MTWIFLILGISILLNLILFIRGFKLSLAVSMYENNTDIYEKKFDEYETFYKKLKETVNYIKETITNIDIRGSFEADDETGIIYKAIKGLSLELAKFFTENEIDEEADKIEKESA